MNFTNRFTFEDFETMQLKTQRVDLMSLSSKDSNSINQILTDSPCATVFHTIEWNQMLISQFLLKNFTLIAYLDNAPVGLYIFYSIDGHRCQSPPTSLFTVYGGPICSNNHPLIINTLVKEGEKLQRNSLFQIWVPPKYDLSPLEKIGYSPREVYKTPLWDLRATEEELWSRLDRDKRTKIRKASKNQVRIINGNLSNLDEYYGMVVGTLNGRIDPRSGVVIHLLPITFYKKVLENLVHHGMARFFLATYDDKVISGTIVLYFKNTIYGWDIGWRREYAQISPNDILLWEVAAQARQQGYETFDLMVIDPVRQPGIAKWKIDFGVDVYPCYSFQKATPGYRIRRGLQTLFTNPGKLVNKLIRKRTD